MWEAIKAFFTANPYIVTGAKVVGVYEGGVAVASVTFRNAQVVPVLKDVGTFGYTMFRDMRKNPLVHATDSINETVKAFAAAVTPEQIVNAASEKIAANLKKDIENLSTLGKETKENNEALRGVIKEYTEIHKANSELQADLLKVLNTKKEKAEQLHVNPTKQPA